MLGSATRVFALAACLAALASALPPLHLLSPSQQLVHDCMHAITTYDIPTATALYQDIKQAGHLDDNAFKLAGHMKGAQESAEFQRLDTGTQSQFDALIDQLPVSVRNVVFATTVCILNREYNEFLFSPNNDFIHDSDSRNLFLWRPGGNVTGSNWTQEATSSASDWKFINIYGEYMYADDSHFIINRRNVYTYIPSVWTGSSSNVWHLKAAGDDVIIQNLWYSGGGENTREYLYAAVNTYNYDSNRRRAFSWDDTWGSDSAHFWRIVSC